MQHPEAQYHENDGMQGDGITFLYRLKPCSLWETGDVHVCISPDETERTTHT